MWQCRCMTKVLRGTSLPALATMAAGFSFQGMSADQVRIAHHMQCQTAVHCNSSAADKFPFTAVALVHPWVVLQINVGADQAFSLELRCGAASATKQSDCMMAQQLNNASAPAV